MNSNSLNADFDPGKDGDDYHPFVAHDAFSYSLDYYEDDFAPIRNLNNNIQAANAEVNKDGLYNGNITRMTTSLRDLDNDVVPIHPTRYTYDQLHRIKNMTQFNAINLNTFSWNTGTTLNYQTDYSYDANGNLSSLNRNNGNGVQIDRMQYTYDDPDNNNLLDYVRDPLGDSPQINDFASQSPKNYTYDGAGNMVKDEIEDISNIEWDQYGKIRKIYRSQGPSGITPELQYHYDAMGNRIVKIVKNGEKEEDWVYTFYMRDASGNVMATYEGLYDPEKQVINTLYEKEHHLYGSSRLGIKQSDKPNINLADAPPQDAYQAARISGLRNYELSNHLGNVLSVVSDNKLLSYQGNALPLYEPEILSYSDYYPFGWAMPGRSESSNYRYGFNGKEKDDGVKGSGVQYDYGFRIYDARIARFLSVDPLTKSYPMLTPYQFASNRPIDGVDLDGLEYEDYREYKAEALYNISLNIFHAKDLEKETFDNLNHALYQANVFEVKGRELAARNMLRYIEGKGGYDIYSYSALNGNQKFGSANGAVKAQIESKLFKQARDIENLPAFGVEFIGGADVDNNNLLVVAFTDLGAAFGRYKILAKGVFDLSLDENGRVEVDGKIYYTFVDKYDWHKDQGSVLSFLTNSPSHNAMISLQELGAKDFYIRAYYSQKVSGTIPYLDYGEMSDNTSDDAVEVHRDKDSNHKYGMSESEKKIIKDYRKKD